MLIPLTNVDKKSLETEFLIAICRQLGDKTLFLVIFDLHLLIVKSVLDCPLPGVVMSHLVETSYDKLYSMIPMCSKFNSNLTSRFFWS